jgi:hypothetical protein
MRIIHLVAITFTALFLSTIGACADGTWCANYKNGGPRVVDVFASYEGLPRFEGSPTLWQD